MQRININPYTQSHATLTGLVMAIYSRQPVAVALYASETSATECRLTATNIATGASISEERTAYRATPGAGVAECEFEISRMLQIVCPVDDLLQRVAYDGTPVSLADAVRLTLELKVGGSWQNTTSAQVECRHAAVDWGEAIGGAMERRRLWMNFPQTISAGRDSSSEDAIPVTGLDAVYDAYPDEQSLTDGGYELDAWALFHDQGDSICARLEAGLPATMGAGCYGAISQGQGETTYTEKEYALVPCLQEQGRGVYLRWLHRDGSVGYWLFQRSKHSVTTTASQAFERSLEGVPAAPVGGVIRNPAAQSFALSESYTIGATELTDGEYAYLLGLASSPLVEMLQGGTRENPVWVRVNLSPATYTREIPRSELPRLREIEMVIVPPARNAARL